MTQHCPCLSGLTFEECCQPIHHGRKPAATAEALMRSRFSAFATGNSEYLLSSWHPTTRPKVLNLNDNLQWFRLDIVATSAGGPFDVEGIVEFVAHYREETVKGRIRGAHKERSLFRKNFGSWRYVGIADV